MGKCGHWPHETHGNTAIMITNNQVAVVTAFLQIIGTWMLVVRVAPACQKLMQVRQTARQTWLSDFMSMLVPNMIGFGLIVFVSGAWNIPEGQSALYDGAVVFIAVAASLYTLLIAIKSLPEAQHLRIAAAVVWLIVIVITWAYCQSGRFGFGQEQSWQRTLSMYSPAVTITALTIFLAVFVASDWVGIFMKRWDDAKLTDQGLPSAGKWIGRFERFLIVCCLIANQPAGIAILVTAKGILRFGEIRDDRNEQHQRKMVEYILIGSMCSYAIALSLGWIACFLIQQIRYQ